MTVADDLATLLLASKHLNDDENATFLPAYERVKAAVSRLGGGLCDTGTCIDCGKTVVIVEAHE